MIKCIVLCCILCVASAQATEEAEGCEKSKELKSAHSDSRLFGPGSGGTGGPSGPVGRERECEPAKDSD